MLLRAVILVRWFPAGKWPQKQAPRPARVRQQGVISMTCEAWTFEIRDLTLRFVVWCNNMETNGYYGTIKIILECCPTSYISEDQTVAASDIENTN